MKLSTKGRYASRLMLDLAVHYGKGTVLLKDIAQRQEISEKYLGHIISLLKAAGLVGSSRGARGGYFLAKAPQDITLGEVVKSAGENMDIVDCIKTPGVCNRTGFCVTHDIWGDISLKIMDVLDSTTLKDMVGRHHEKYKFQAMVYNI